MQKILNNKLKVNQKISNEVKEYILGFLILIAFITYYFDLLKDGMMMSGLIAVVILSYIALIWSEKVHDEREEFIRSKVDRWLYIIVIGLFLINIIYKTYIHQSYMSEILILSILALSKIILTKVAKSTN